MLETQAQAQLCEMHGVEMAPGESFMHNGRTYTGRPSCSKCEAVRREQAIQEQARADECQFRKRQLAAKIPRRYSSACLSGIITDTAAQRDIFDVVTRFATSHGADPSGLVLIGRLGSGKTYTACAIANTFLRTGRTAVYFTTLGVIREIKSTWHSRGETEAQLFKKLVEKDLLVLDEVGVQFGTAIEQAIIANLLDARYGDGRPTIAIGNLTVQEMTAALGERILDRFRQGGRVLIFDWESRRGVLR